MGLEEEMEAFDREWAHDPNKDFSTATINSPSITPPDGATPPVDAEEDHQVKSNKRKKADKAEANKKPKVHENRAIYVSRLPLDTTKAELEESFKKFGIIDRGADGQPRINMYEDDEGNFKGEALIVFFKKESIPNAIRIMDDDVFRLGDLVNGTISVKEADYSYKKEKDGDVIRTKLTRGDRKANDAKNAELNSMSTWTGDETASEVIIDTPAATAPPKKNKWAKVVILKYMFDIEDLVHDYFETKDDIRRRAEEHGTVTNITLFDEEPNGIATVRFKEFEGAENFCRWAHGQRYGDYMIRANLADDKPKFRRSDKHREPVDDNSD